MDRPESWRLSPSCYPLFLECHTRFQDMDVNGHLNNVAFAALFENARVQMHMHVGLRDNMPSDERTMVAAVQIHYLAEGNYPEPVEIGSAIGHIGNSSWRIVQGMFQGDRCIATCDSVVVCREGDKAKPIRGEVRAGLEVIMVRADTL